MNDSTADRLKRRKLDALRRGVHRTSGDEPSPISTHIIGIGSAGAGAIAECLRSLPPAAPKIHVLVIDIGEEGLDDLRSAAANVPGQRADIAVVPLEVPNEDALFEGLRHYPEFLKLEYPHYTWDADFQPWLGPSAVLPRQRGHFKRAVAKAIYGLAYYDGQQTLYHALRNFAAHVEAATSQAVVAIVFGLAGGTGSGIAVDLARHLSTRMLGRRVLVTGIGIAPCDGDPLDRERGQLFATLNELDCLSDEGKNRGLVTSCGELFRNPFTAGFIMIPQQHVWETTRDLSATHARVDQEIATLLTSRGGASLWETLRLLNWVAAPSTQHSAARTPWGPKWIHMLGFADAAGHPIVVGPDLPCQMGLLPTYRPEFIEARVSELPSARMATLAAELEKAFRPDVAPQIVSGEREGSIQFILPSISKADLVAFYDARSAYDSAHLDRRILDHSLMLDQGLVLSERSNRLEGMAGASLGNSTAWIAVPLDDLRGPPTMPSLDSVK